ncbi:MAG TPA: L,D-transpeptidase [Streptosporangiaceae bacterium]
MRAWLARIGGSLSVSAWLRGRVGPVPRAVIALAVLAAAVGVGTLAAVVSSGSGSTPAGASPGQAAAPQIAAPVPVSPAALASLPQATTFTTTPAAPLDPAPFTVTSGLVLRALTAQVVYASPGKAPVAVLPATELGGPTWVPVVQTSPGWDEVLLPSKPNRSSGWIYTGGANSSHVDVRSSPYLVRIAVGARKLSIVDSGHTLGTWTVAVGAPGTPTPTGRTFILALLAPAQPTYSPLILPLGFHSDTLDTYGGGPGTVGLHGWPDPSVFGQAISHGCVRVPATALHLLAQVPLGSLVLITS